MGGDLSFNTMKKFLILCGAAFLPFMAAQWAWAVTQGLLGPSSTMTINVEIVIGRELRVFSLDPVDLGVFDFTQAQMQGNDTFCVYDNGATFGQTYRITFTSTNNPGNFELANGGNVIDYQVEYDDSQAGTNFRAAGSGTPITGNINASSGDTNCTSVGGDNGNVRITVTNAQAGNSPAGVYTDTLSILVEPE